MALSNSPVFLQTPHFTPAYWVNADGTNKKTLVTAGANGTKVLGGLIASTDSSAGRDLNLYLTRSAVAYLLGTIHVPLSAGSDGTTNGVKLFNTTLIPGLPLDQFGQPFLFLESGDTLQAGLLVAVTAATNIFATTVSVDF